MGAESASSAWAVGVEAEVEAEAEVVERARFTAAEEDEKGDLVERCAWGYGHVILGFYGGYRLGFVGWLVAPMCVCVWYLEGFKGDGFACILFLFWPKDGNGREKQKDVHLELLYHSACRAYHM